MAYMTQAFIALAVIAVVAIAAVSFEPANPFASWLELAKRYGTDRLPSQFVFTGEHILFGATRGPLRSLKQYAVFDATLDEYGLWLHVKGTIPDGCPPTLKIPGTHIRSVKQKGEDYHFEIFAEPPVKMVAHGALGKGIMRRCRPDPGQ